MLKSLLFTLVLLIGNYFVTGEFSLLASISLFLLAYISPRYILFLITLIFLIQTLFYSYFKRPFYYADIHNFFTHFEETFETFFALLSMFWLPLFLFVIATIILSSKKEFYKPKGYIALRILLIMIYLQQTLPNKLFLQPYHKTETIMIDTLPLSPKREADINILFVIAESMKYNAYISEKLNQLDGFSKKIFSAATCTDVTLPLLINSQTNPLKLNQKSETNLFKLAKKNGFHTTFISMQSKKALRYISPYLQTNYIDNYLTHEREEIAPKYDTHLLEYLQKTSLKPPQFIVFQQIGQHAPYSYFHGEKSSNPKENYYRSIDASFQLYHSLLKRLKQSKQPFIMIVTSDHGEFTGEEGRWGHNTFAKTIYEVPLFIASNRPLPKYYHDIASHYHLSQYITYLLGYHDSCTLSKEKSIVNGTMITREDGFITPKRDTTH
jgi:glucan phosphoethanolaminetransferase (alkaline phosphatase superfamily)